MVVAAFNTMEPNVVVAAHNNRGQTSLIVLDKKIRRCNNNGHNGHRSLVLYFVNKAESHISYKGVHRTPSTQRLTFFPHIPWQKFTLRNMLLLSLQSLVTTSQNTNANPIESRRRFLSALRSGGGRKQVSISLVPLLNIPDIPFRNC